MCTDNEVSFKIPSHNINANATVTEETQGLDHSLEEGECVRSSEGDDNYLKDKHFETTHMTMAEVIDKKIDDSMSKVHSYFKQRFKDMSRVAELEKQLEENK